MEENAIYNHVAEYGSQNLKDNFLGIFAADEFNKYVDLLSLRNEITTPIAIFNTKKRKSGGEHWIAIVYCEDDSLVIFDSFGKKGFKKFFIDDDIKHFNKFAKISDDSSLSSNDSIDFLRIIVDKQKYIEKRKSLTKLCQSFFNYCLTFNIEKDSFTINYLFDQIQEENNNYCGAYVLLFIIEVAKLKHLNIKSISKLLTKIFSDIGENDRNKNLSLNTKLIEDFIKTYKIEIDGNF